VYSTQPTKDGYTGDQSLLAPAFITSDEELDQVVERMAAAVYAVERNVKGKLAARNKPAATSVNQRA